MDDLEEEEDAQRTRFTNPGRPWWRFTGTIGRFVLASIAVLLLATAVFGVRAARRFFEHDSRFLIAGGDHLRLSGNNQVSREDLLAVFGGDMGRNIFFVPLSQRRAQIEQIPWVERATVMRLLPDQIRVSIVERKPVAFVRHGEQIGLVDANGVLLDMPAADMAQHHYSFPVLTGIDKRDSQSLRMARMALYLRLMSALDANGQHNSEQISEIDLTDPEDARVIIPEQGKDILAHFGQDHFLERYQRYKAHIAEWRQQYPHLSTVDLRYDQQVVLEMAPGSQTAPSAPSTNSAGPKAKSESAAGAPAKLPVQVQHKAAERSAKRATETANSGRSTGRSHTAKRLPLRHATKLSPARGSKVKTRPSEREIERAAARQRAEREKRRAVVRHATPAANKLHAGKHKSAKKQGKDREPV